MLDLSDLNNEILDELVERDKYLDDVTLTEDNVLNFVMTSDSGPTNICVDLSRFMTDTFTERTIYSGYLSYDFLRNDNQRYRMDFTKLLPDLRRYNEYITSAIFNPNTNRINYSTANGLFITPVDLSTINNTILEIGSQIDINDIFVCDIDFRSSNFTLEVTRNDGMRFVVDLSRIREDIDNIPNDVLIEGGFDRETYNVNLIKRLSLPVNINLNEIRNLIDSVRDEIENLDVINEYVTNGLYNINTSDIILERNNRNDIDINLALLSDRINDIINDTDINVNSVEIVGYSILLNRVNSSSPFIIDLNFIEDNFEIIDNQIVIFDNCIDDVKEGLYNDGVLTGFVDLFNYSYRVERSNGLDSLDLDLGFIREDLIGITNLDSKIQINCEDISRAINGNYSDGSLSNVIRTVEYEHEFTVTKQDSVINRLVLDIDYIREDLVDVRTLLDSQVDSYIIDTTEFVNYTIEVDILNQTSFDIDLSGIQDNIQTQGDRITEIEGEYMTASDDSYISNQSVFVEDTYNLLINMINEPSFDISLDPIRQEINELRLEVIGRDDLYLSEIDNITDSLVYEFILSDSVTRYQLDISNSEIRLTNVFVDRETYTTQFEFENEYTFTTNEFAKIRPYLYDVNELPNVTSIRDGDWVCGYEPAASEENEKHLVDIEFQENNIVVTYNNGETKNNPF